MGAPFFMPPLAAKTGQPGFARGKQANLALLEEMHSPFGGWRHHLALWEACHWIRGSRGSPMNPVPLPPPQFGGAAKGKRLNGQARRLTSPHLEVLCRTSTGDYKAPLCCELLMKELLRGALLSHHIVGGRWCRKAPKGGSHRRWLIDVMFFMTCDTER